MKDFINKREANFADKGFKTVHLYIDNGTEYLSEESTKFCLEKRITYHSTITYTPHQNGAAERMIRTITEKVRSLLFESHLPQ